MSKPVLTVELAYAAGKDEANRQMHKDGRVRWNKADYFLATKVVNSLLDQMRVNK